MKAWTPSDSEWAHAVRGIYDAFGTVVEPEPSQLREQLRPANRRVAVGDERGIVGGCFAYDFKLSLSGGSHCKAAGLAGVGISPTAQGRGGLQAMMQQHLRQSIDLGDAASVLMASESGLYSRYGYGVVTDMVQWRLRTGEFSVDKSAIGSLPESDIRIIHDRAEAITVLSTIHATCAATRCMEIIRDELWWRHMLEDPEPGWTSVGRNKFIAVSYSSDGVADGYAIYSIAEDSESLFSHGRPYSTVVLTEICATTVQSEVALFEYLVGLPWCRELIWELGPVDPFIRHHMHDPRQLWQHCRVDMMWLRPLNLKKLLTARSYACNGSVTLAYTDPLFPELSGRWLLTVDDGAVQLEESVSDKYVALGPSEFSTVYAGAVRVGELAFVKKISGDYSQIMLLDQMMSPVRAPFNSTRF